MSTTNGGLQHIREAVAARTSSRGVMSRETGVSLMKLDDFAAGRVDLPEEKLQALVGFIWQWIRYDPELDVLRPVAQPEARSIGVLPQLDTSRLPRYQPGPSQHGGPQPVIAAPKKPKRAGWAGGWG